VDLHTCPCESAVAPAGATVIEIPASHFWILVHDPPYFAQLVMRVMAQRLRRQSGSTAAPV
jgi:hypothetical protein